jgi:hypothetical protein
VRSPDKNPPDSRAVRRVRPAPGAERRWRGADGAHGSRGCSAPPAPPTTRVVHPGSQDFLTGTGSGSGSLTLQTETPMCYLIFIKHRTYPKKQCCGYGMIFYKPDPDPTFQLVSDTI